HSHADQPNDAGVDEFYLHPITNHYSRIVHANSPVGYAFPYDDVTPDGAPDQSGAAFDGNPRRLTLTVGSKTRVGNAVDAAAPRRAACRRSSAARHRTLCGRVHE